jgi:hypothetical protein
LAHATLRNIAALAIAISGHPCESTSDAPELDKVQGTRITCDISISTHVSPLFNMADANLLEALDNQRPPPGHLPMDLLSAEHGWPSHLIIGCEIDLIVSTWVHGNPVFQNTTSDSGKLILE